MSIVVDRLRLVGAPGTNKVMAGELSRLVRAGLRQRRLPDPQKDGLGALAYPFDAEIALLAAQYHRTAVRVLWDLYDSRAERLEPLFADLCPAIAGDERAYGWDGARISVETFGVEGFAAGERQIVGVVKNALVEAFATRGVRLTVAPSGPDLLFSVRRYDGRIVVSLDLAGRPMNERGYRMRAGPAPLREDLAANLVMLTRHDARHEALCDPMAGAGTIVIEAAAMARAHPVWMSGRKPAALSWPVFAAHASARPEPLFPDTRPVLFGCELDGDAVERMRENFEAAGVSEDVDVFAGSFADLAPERLIARAQARGVETGVILSNPPYGERLGSADEVLRLYRELGEWCRELPGWRAGFFVGNDAFPEAFGGRPRVMKPLKNGPLRAAFYLYDL